MTAEENNYTCPQCPKIFATRSNLKRHMENPNIHNIPYARSRDQKRWKGHAKKVSSRAETTERMRKWRAENRDKNKRNDLRCRVYRLARQKYGEQDSEEKTKFINEEINRRLGRRMLLEQSKKNQDKEQAAALGLACLSSSGATSPSNTTGSNNNEDIEEAEEKTINELPFYCAPLHKIELPSLLTTTGGTTTVQKTEPCIYKTSSQSPSSPPQNNEERRNSNSSQYSSGNSTTASKSPHLPPPSMQSLLNPLPTQEHLVPPLPPQEQQEYQHPL